MRLTLDGAGANLASIDLGEPGERGYFEEGELANTGGNLYLNLDGEEYGSLFFFQRDGVVTITLGAFDPHRHEWVEKGVLDRPFNAPRTEGQIVRDHIGTICSEAGLPVMAPLLDLLLDREEDGIDAADFLALSADHVARAYANLIGPAIDTIGNLMKATL